MFSHDNVQIWNFRTGDLLKAISVQKLRPQDSTTDYIVGISPDFKYLVTRHDQRIKVWNLNSLNQPLQTLILNDGEFIEKIIPDLEKISLDFKHLVTTQSQVETWNVKNSSQSPYKNFSHSTIGEDFKNINGYFVSEDRREIIDSQTGKIHHFQTSLGLDNYFKLKFVYFNQKHQIAVLVTDPIFVEGSGPFIVGTREEGQVIKIYRLGDNKLLRAVSGFDGDVKSLEVTPNGNLVIIYTISKEYGIISLGKPTQGIHNPKPLETRTFLTSTQKGNLKVESSISSDGKTAAISDGTNVGLFNLDTGKSTHIFIDSRISNLTFSPDGQNLISESDGKIRVWRVPK